MTDEIDRDAAWENAKPNPALYVASWLIKLRTPPPYGSWIPYFPPSRLQIRAGCLLITRGTTHHIIAHIR